MQRIKLGLIIFLIPLYTGAQEVILQTDFASRDFFVDKETIYYIEKRDVIITNKNKKTNYFIGGYGLELFNDYENGEIISASNELVNPVSSVRFYNTKNQTIDQVYYYKKSRCVDFLVIPELKVFVLSLVNNKIIIINYSKKPTFKEVATIPQNAISRKILYHNNKLYYTSDLGEISSYSFADNSTQKLQGITREMISDLVVENDYMIYTTTSGKIVKIRQTENTKSVIEINNNFITNSLVYKDKLICASWSGKIYIINIHTFKIEKELSLHRRTVIKIWNDNNEFYSSSLDKTVKKWKLN